MCQAGAAARLTESTVEIVPLSTFTLLTQAILVSKMSMYLQEKGKLVERQGRKVTGLSVWVVYVDPRRMIAGLPGKFSFKVSGSSQELVSLLAVVLGGG